MLICQANQIVAVEFQPMPFILIQYFISQSDRSNEICTKSIAFTQFPHLHTRHSRIHDRYSLTIYIDNLEYVHLRLRTRGISGHFSRTFHLNSAITERLLWVSALLVFADLPQCCQLSLYRLRKSLQLNKETEKGSDNQELKIHACSQ